MQKSPSPVDRYVGSRVKMRRMLISMSQEKLGDALGITFQQVQKYERGTNRIGASRLHRIAQILGVPVTFFYEGAPSEGHAGEVRIDSAANEIVEFLGSAEGIALARAFLQIESAQHRWAVLDLCRALGKNLSLSRKTRSVQSPVVTTTRQATTGSRIRSKVGNKGAM